MLTLQTKTVSLHSINSAVHTYTVFFLDTLSFFKFSIPCGKVTKKRKIIIVVFLQTLKFCSLTAGVTLYADALLAFTQSFPLSALWLRWLQAVSGARSKQLPCIHFIAFSQTSILIFSSILERI